MIYGLVGNFIHINNIFNACNIHCEIDILDINPFLRRKTYIILLFLKAFEITEHENCNE